MSIPIHRDTHFYGKTIKKKEKMSRRCQSPIHRDTHFYLGCNLGAEQPSKSVSIPYPSGHPFLPRKVLRRNREGNVSIPYPSGHPFLQTVGMSAARILQLMCQSPIHRDTHFYNGRLASSRNWKTCVNPLSIGTPISTEFAKLRLFLRTSVNPLSIGTPISTLLRKMELK